MPLDEQGAGAFVYHRFPAGLRGDVLYPLNQLADVYPDLYERLKQNYASRPDIAALRILPLGNCLWNDVLFLSPVHPSTHKVALEALGLAMPAGWRRYFRIDAGLLDPASAMIYESRTIFWSGEFDVDDASATLASECVAFNAEGLRRHREVPVRSIEYLRTVAPGAGFPLFLGMPHVLYRGHIDLDQPGIDVIEV